MLWRRSGPTPPTGCGTAAVRCCAGAAAGRQSRQRQAVLRAKRCRRTASLASSSSPSRTLLQARRRCSSSPCASSSRSRCCRACTRCGGRGSHGAWGAEEAEGSCRLGRPATLRSRCCTNAPAAGLSQLETVGNGGIVILLALAIIVMVKARCWAARLGKGKGCLVERQQQPPPTSLRRIRCTHQVLATALLATAPPVCPVGHQQRHARPGLGRLPACVVGRPHQHQRDLLAPVLCLLVSGRACGQPQPRRRRAVPVPGGFTNAWPPPGAQGRSCKATPAANKVTPPPPRSHQVMMMPMLSEARTEGMTLAAAKRCAKDLHWASTIVIMGACRCCATAWGGRRGLVAEAERSKGLQGRLLLGCRMRPGAAPARPALGAPPTPRSLLLRTPRSRRHQRHLLLADRLLRCQHVRRHRNFRQLPQQCALGCAPAAPLGC